MALKTPGRRKSEAGLTLVELLIAVALLGIVLLGIAPLFILSVKSNYTANEYTSIHNLARDRLEQLMNLPLTDPQLSAATANFANDLPPTLPDPVTGIPPSTIINPLSRTYTVTHYRTTPPVLAGDPHTLTAVAAGQQYDFKRIDVTVTSSSFGAATGLGIGNRTARVSGFLRNTDPVNNVF